MENWLTSIKQARRMMRDLYNVFLFNLNFQELKEFLKCQATKVERRKLKELKTIPILIDPNLKIAVYKSFVFRSTLSLHAWRTSARRASEAITP